MKSTFTSIIFLLLIFPFISNAQILNNSIGNDQTACENGVVFPFHGSLPTGGTGTFTYLWEASINQTAWSAAPGQNDTIDYINTIPLTGNNYLYFRRIVFSGSATDTSNTITVTILLGTTAISNNNVSADQQVCPGQVPFDLNGSSPSGGTGTYYYMWLKDDDPSFSSPVFVDGIYNQVNYVFPLSPDKTYWYARIVANNAAMDECATPSNFVKVDVISITTDSIQNNQEMCTGDVAGPILGDFPETNYLSSFSFLWEESTDGTNFTPAGGVNNDFMYNPGQLFLTTFYRRRITAVLMNSCGNQDTLSNIVTIKVNQPISNNIITESLSDTVCDGGTTLIMSDFPVGGGNGIYEYFWQTSTDNLVWTAAPGINNQEFYNTEPIYYSRYYRRHVLSGGCEDFSNSVQIIHSTNPSITNNNINISGTDSVFLCGGSPVGLINGLNPSGGNGAYTYYWYKSTNNYDWVLVNNFPFANQNMNISNSLDSTTKYVRVINSGNCWDESNQVKIEVGGATNNYITGNQSYCDASSVDSLHGPFPPFIATTNIQFLWQQSNDSLNWVNASGTNWEKNYFPASITSTTFYRRIVVDLSPTCTSVQNISNVIKISIAEPIGNNVIYPVDFPDNSICYNTNTQVGNLNMPTGGDGNFTYLWQDSIAGSSWQAASGPLPNNLYGFQTANLIENTFYRRLVTSCGITSTSNTLEIVVDPLPTYYIEIEDSICVIDGAELYFEYYGTSPWTLEMEDGVNSWTIGPETSSIYIDFLTPTENTTFTILNIMDGNGCYAANPGTQHEVYVFNSPFAYAGYDTVICGLGTQNGLSAAISIAGNNGEWFSSDPIYFDDETNPNTNIYVDNYGEYVLEWIEYNEYCDDHTSIKVQFIEQLEDSINYAGEDLFLSRNDIVVLNGFLPYGYIGLWQFHNGYGLFSNDYDPYATIFNIEAGKNILTWTVSNDYCGLKTDTIIVDIARKIIVPNGFSPNGDGENDYFVIRGLNTNANSRLYILNRWGNEINYFESYKNDWNGKDFNGVDLPDDTYFYMLEFDENNDVFKGFVVIKR